MANASRASGRGSAAATSLTFGWLVKPGEAESAFTAPAPSPASPIRIVRVACVALMERPEKAPFRVGIRHLSLSQRENGFATGNAARTDACGARRRRLALR